MCLSLKQLAEGPTVCKPAHCWIKVGAVHWTLSSSKINWNWNCWLLCFVVMPYYVITCRQFRNSTFMLSFSCLGFTGNQTSGVQYLHWNFTLDPNSHSKKFFLTPESSSHFYFQGDHFVHVSPHLVPCDSYHLAKTNFDCRRHTNIRSGSLKCKCTNNLFIQELGRRGIFKSLSSG